jgi:hypothetical protein
MSTYQYQQRQIPKLLQAKPDASVTIVNEVAELNIDGKKMVVPTAEAFHRLTKKVALLEQRLAIIDNKASRAARQKYE